MKARDIMTTDVITVREHEPVASIADTMLRHRISAVPVVDAQGRLAGIVSEGDLMNRPETGTHRGRSWWLELLADQEEIAHDYRKTRGGKASDVMTAPVLTASEDDSVEEIAEKLERHRIKRVPIVRDGRVVGIVSRANLLHGFGRAAPRSTAGGQAGTQPVTQADADDVRRAVFDRLVEAGIRGNLVNVVVSYDVVELWGAVESADQMSLAETAAQDAARDRKVVNKLGIVDRGSFIRSGAV